MKARLHKGPLAGRVINNPPNGLDYNSIIVYGRKKMSREQRYRYLANKEWHEPSVPMVQCVYRKISALTVINGMAVEVPCVHPDGSIFYVYDRTLKDSTRVS